MFLREGRPNLVLQGKSGADILQRLYSLWRVLPKLLWRVSGPLEDLPIPPEAVTASGGSKTGVEDIGCSRLTTCGATLGLPVMLCRTPSRVAVGSNAGKLV